MNGAKTKKSIILFDGICNLCNSAVNFIIKRDKADNYRFAPLQSDIASDLLNERAIDSSKIDSLILIVPGEAYYLKSSAALKIGRSFGGIWHLLALLEWLPRPIRDWGYDLIARFRYRIFGKKSECMVPEPGIKSKFLTYST